MYTRFRYAKDKVTEHFKSGSDNDVENCDVKSDSVEGEDYEDDESQTELIDDDSSSISSDTGKNYTESDDFDDINSEEDIDLSQPQIQLDRNLSHNPPLDDSSDEEDSISADDVEDMLEKKDAGDILVS